MNTIVPDENLEALLLPTVPLLAPRLDDVQD